MAGRKGGGEGRKEEGAGKKRREKGKGESRSREWAKGIE